MIPAPEAADITLWRRTTLYKKSVPFFLGLIVVGDLLGGGMTELYRRVHRHQRLSN